MISLQLHQQLGSTVPAPAWKLSVSVLLWFSLLLPQIAAGNGNVTVSETESPPPCTSSVVHPYDSTLHEPIYRVGVLANQGTDAAYEEFHSTFEDYLTQTAGRRFDPPITFEMRALSLGTVFQDLSTYNIDFVYANPSVFSCVESEYGAQSLVSQISRRVVNGHVHDLTQFGGVIVTLANSTVHELKDVQDKVVAAASISGLGSGQMQFLELQKTGISYINAPQQVVFTSNQGKIVDGLLKGDFDVGFIRTDQLERSNPNPDTVPLDDFLKQFRILNPQWPRPILENGRPFPFETSTPLYPEWNVAALNHVSDQVARAVQESLVALADHAVIGKAMERCQAQFGSPLCNDLDFPRGILQATIMEGGNDQDNDMTRCDTTPEIAMTAATALQNGKYAGYRTTLSYLGLRDMQQATGFIHYDEKEYKWKCVRSVEIYDAISCPAGYFRKTSQEVLEGCANEGLPCPEDEGFQCICSPCKRGYDVDVFPLPITDMDQSTSKIEGFIHDNSDDHVGCAKMSLCGSTHQRMPLKFRIQDNLKRQVRPPPLYMFCSVTLDLFFIYSSMSYHSYSV